MSNKPRQHESNNACEAIKRTMIKMPDERQANPYCLNAATLIEQSGACFYIFQKGRLLHVNGNFARCLGFKSPEAAIGTTFIDLVHPDDHKQVIDKIQNGQQGELSRHSFFRVVRSDGKLIWMYMIGGCIDYNGETAYAGFMVDVTSIQNQMKNLQESLKRYETILDDVDVQLGEMDFKGNVTFINDAGCRIWGLPREEIMGLNYRSYMDESAASEFVEMYKEVYRTGNPVKNVILSVLDKDKRPRTIEKSVSPIRDDDGDITGFRMVTRDISDRKEAEDRLAEHRMRLEAIFASVKDAIITVDPQLNVIEANKSTENLCGIAIKDFTGQAFARPRAQCSQACQEILKQTLVKKSAVKEYLIECDHQQRLHQVVSVSSSPLLGPKGNFMGAVMVIRDMTLIRDLKRELRERHRFQSIIGRSKMMQDIYRLLEDLANLDTTVLVTGESGTGKELVARALHYSGNRSFKPFVTVNCAALSENLLESELFGHIRGAFTGALKDKQGRFQAAHKGTILLDEIGDISPMMQIKLLRVLQEKEFERVGESGSQKVDVRVIACTNQDLKGKVQRGEFRQDLYYRLKVVEIALPPLRDRLEDLPLLVEHFLRRFNERFNKKVEGLSSDVLTTFMDYVWPGNVRELEHVMEHAFVLCHGAVITMNHLPADIRNCRDTGHSLQSSTMTKTTLNAERILDALNRTGWNKAKAARLLGIGRRTIYRKIEEFQLLNEHR